MTSAEKAKDRRLRDIYKMTLAEFNYMKEAQGNRCITCSRSFEEFTPYVDHDHRCCPSFDWYRCCSLYIVIHKSVHVVNDSGTCDKRKRWLFVIDFDLCINNVMKLSYQCINHTLANAGQQQGGGSPTHRSQRQS